MKDNFDFNWPIVTICWTINKLMKACARDVCVCICVCVPVSQHVHIYIYIWIDTFLLNVNNNLHVS